MSPKNLARYVDEFAGRRNACLTDAIDQVREIVRNMDGRELPTYSMPLIPAATEKEVLLSSLLSKGQHKYSRYNGLPLRYAGGKSLGVGHIIEHVPDGIVKLVSPFFGGGSIEIACARELGLRVEGYDIFDILTNYWCQQVRSPGKLADQISRWKPNKEQYAVVKKRLKQHWTGENPITDRLSLAAHYWFNHNLSYGPGFLGWMSKIYEDQTRFERLADKVRNFDCDGLSVSCLSFDKAIPKHNDDFLYCDPPYYLDGDSKMFRGIYPQRNFPVHHNGFSHDVLCDLLHEHKGGFILSYNDCEVVRKRYSDFQIIEVEWQYTLGQGETRIGKNRLESGTSHHVKGSHEWLIISNG